jgi:hypothetical protein
MGGKERCSFEGAEPSQAETHDFRASKHGELALKQPSSKCTNRMWLCSTATEMLNLAPFCLNRGSIAFIPSATISVIFRTLPT